MILYIFDYSSGTVFRHLVSEDKKSDNWGDDIFYEVCEANNIRPDDCYYMITNNADIVNI